MAQFDISYDEQVSHEYDPDQDLSLQQSTQVDIGEGVVK